MEIVDLNSIYLSVGSHEKREDGMCIMELAAWLAGEPHSDTPACVSQVIGTFLQRWNDDLDDATRQQLIPYASRILYTAGSAALEEKRAWLATDWVVRVYTPTWLVAAGLTDHAQKLRNLAPVLSESCLTYSRRCMNAARAEAFRATWEGAHTAVVGTPTIRAAGIAAVAAAAWTGIDPIFTVHAALAASILIGDSDVCAQVVRTLQRSAFLLLGAMIEVQNEKSVL